MEEIKKLSNGVDVESVPESSMHLPEMRLGDVVKKAIPVVDFSTHDRALLIRKILDVSHEFGFFQMINHGVSSELLEETMMVFKEFHGMSKEEKVRECSNVPDYCMKFYSTSNIDDHMKQALQSWKDSVAFNCYPLEKYAHFWPQNPPKYRIKNPSVRSFILDCELVAYDRGKQKILPFQILSTRARKNVAVSDIKVEVCVFAFDLLYLDGQPLIQRELNVRRELLYDSFKEETGYFQFATAIITNDLEEIQKFLDASVDGSCEGLIIKTLKRDATYEPSKRSHNWLKLKKDYIDSIGDSLDLVPIAAFHGRGKRTGVYGAFLLACYDNDNEEFQSICKIGTGFSEAMLEERSTSLRSKVIPEPKSYYRCGDTINPDVWFEPTEVWEVKAADLTISPVHRAGVGIVDSDKGISLRFPRLVRVRKDKNPEEASSSEQVADMYNAQKHTHQNNKDDNEDD